MDNLTYQLKCAQSYIDSADGGKRPVCFGESTCGTSDESRWNQALISKRLAAQFPRRAKTKSTNLHGQKDVNELFVIAHFEAAAMRLPPDNVR